MTSSIAVRGIPPEDRKKEARRRQEERVSSQQQIAQRNWQHVFEEIIVLDGPSAKDIAEITGLGQSTVSGVLDQMRESKLILIEDPGERLGRGRRPRPIRVNQREHYMVGVEIASDQLIGLIVDLYGQPVTSLKHIELPTTPPDVPVNTNMVVDGVRKLVDELTDELHRLRDDAKGRPLLGLGVEVGGHVDSRRGTVVFSPNLRWGGEWTGPIPLRQRLRDATRLSPVIDNDVHATGVAQRWFGAARGLESFAIAYVSADGTGGAVFDDGEVYRGATGKAAELGHLVIDSGGRRCRCGGRGHVEAYATPVAVGRELGVPTETALQRAHDGDPAARRAFADAGAAMGRGVATFLNAMDPGKVIVTGDQFSPSDSDGRTLASSTTTITMRCAALSRRTLSPPCLPTGSSSSRTKTTGTDPEAQQA